MLETDPQVARRRRRKRPLMLIASVSWITIVVLVAILAPVLPIKSPTAPDYDQIASGPSMKHLLGTDVLGRDLLARLIYGGRASLLIGFSAVVLGLSFGLVLGLLAGYFRGKIGLVISAGVDVLLAFPSLILIMVLVAVRGASVATLIFGLGVTMTPAFTRLARAATTSFASRGFVTSARVQGMRRSRILIREILPNVLPTMQAYALVVVAIAMVAEGSLSFLGLGIPPPTPSWGGMIAAGRGQLQSAPHIALIPAAVLFLTVLAFNFAGDSLRSDVGGNADR
jgi:peptide/nickel transport system permease protein